MAAPKRLLEAIVDANDAAAEGRAGELQVGRFADALPLTILTCIDPRLNRLFPSILGLSNEQFIWLRNAGNIITCSTSSTVRSVALSVLLNGAKEIVVIGHTDCLMAKSSVTELLARLKAYGIERTSLPISDLQGFFGLCGSETSNVMKAVGFLRQSPVIPARVPVHGLIVNTATGRLDWVVNGYETHAPSVAENVSPGETSPAVAPALVPLSTAGPVKLLVRDMPPIGGTKPTAPMSVAPVGPPVGSKPLPVPPPMIGDKKPLLKKSIGQQNVR
jgi:carbonic anhydrase